MHNDRSALDQLFSLYLQLATYPPQGTVHTYLAYLPTYLLPSLQSTGLPRTQTYGSGLDTA